MGLKKNIALLFVPGAMVVISVMAILLLIIQYQKFHNTYFSEIREETRRNNFFMVRAFKRSLANNDLARMNHICSGFKGANPMVIKIIAKGKGPIFTSADGPGYLKEHISEPEIRNLFRSNTDEDVLVKFDKRMKSFMIYHCVRFVIGQQNYILVMVSKCSSVTLLMQQTREAIIYLSLAGVFSALLVVIYFFFRIRNPLNRLFDSMSHIAAGELDTEIYIPGQGLLREIALCLTTLTGQLKKQLFSLQASAEERELIFDTLSEAVMLVRADGKVERFNRAAKKLFFPLQNRGDKEVLYCPEQIKAFIQGAVEKHTLSGKCFYQDPQNRRLSLLLNAVSFNISGEVFVLISATDLTDFDRLEAEHREFISAISHEMKTPLTGIIGAVDAINAGALEKSEYKERCLETLASQTARLNTLLLNFLTLNSLEHVSTGADFLPVRIASLLNSAAEVNRDAAANAGITIGICEICEGEICCDTQLMVQALSNLVSNAVFHSGTEKIELRAVDNGKGQVIFSVLDHGCGIPGEHREKIFNRFYRVPGSSKKVPGSGIGLAIVKSIAIYHHGSVQVRDVPGGGTEFQLFIPRINPD